MKYTLIALAFALSTAAAGAQDIVKVAYHVNTDVDTAAGVLKYITNELKASPTDKIVVVTLGPGIDFLVRGAKDSTGRKFSAEVSELAARGVEFRVCNNAMKSRHVDAEKLLPQAQVIPAGVKEIARLQAKEGFAYFKP